MTRLSRGRDIFAKFGKKTNKWVKCYAVPVRFWAKCCPNNMCQVSHFWTSLPLKNTYAGFLLKTVNSLYKLGKFFNFQVYHTKNSLFEKKKNERNFEEYKKNKQMCQMFR